jgi:MFS family permease
LLAVSTALPAYIQSNFLGQFMNVNMISLFFAAGNLITVIAILLFPGLIKKTTNYFLTQIILILYAASLLGLVLATNAGSAFVSFVIFSVALNLVWINMDILVESFSSNASTGRTRTIYFTFINAGWILSPILTTYLIGKGEYALSFLIAAFLIVPFFLIFTHQGKKLKDKIKYQKESLALTIKKMWQNKNMRGIFFVAILLQLFFSSAVVYIPFYLFKNLGMGWEILGPIFSIMLIPFVLIEIPAGIIADKYIGEKELLYIGFFILVISLFLFYYINVPNVLAWTIVLFLSRVGAALIEAMRETYFFKIVDAEEVGCINIFRLAGPLAYLLGAGLAILTLAFFPLNYLFLFLSIIMLSGFVFVASIKDTK